MRMFEHLYADYTDGIVTGVRLQAKDTDELLLSPGIIKYQGRLYHMEESACVEFEHNNRMNYLKIRFDNGERTSDGELFHTQVLLTNEETCFPYEMELATRLDSLMKIRENILDIVGDDRSVFGSSDEVIEGNLAEAIYKWLECGKDRGKFYDWMREKGYLASPKETVGYWKLVRSFENKYEPSVSSDFYSETWGGGGGSYTYRCQTTFDYNYSGSTHDNCRGEFVENIGTASHPKDKYIGGERVEIDLKIEASTSPNICFHCGATLGASITSVNVDDPFVGYDTSLYDVSEKITRSYIMTGKNDTNTGYWGESATVGGEMPSGSANGDKVYIVIGMGGGNYSVETAYEYEWVVK